MVKRKFVLDKEVAASNVVERRQRAHIDSDASHCCGQIVRKVPNAACLADAGTELLKGDPIGSFGRFERAGRWESVHIRDDRSVEPAFP